MALDFFTKYTPRANAGDPNYPFGSAKNDGVPGDKTGSPLDKDWLNDFLGFFQKLLDYAGITPSGVSDTILASDFFDALVKRINALSPYLIASGPANTYAVSGDPAYTTYFAGMKIRARIGNTNTGASTMNVEGLGAKSIVKYVSTPLVAGDLPVGAIVEIQYDGTNFQLQHVHNINLTLASLILTGAAASPPVANALVKDNIIKGWINFDMTVAAGSSIRDSFNVSSVVDITAGEWRVNWDTDFANANYCVNATAMRTSGGNERGVDIQDGTMAVGSVDIFVYSEAFAGADSEVVCVSAIGGQ